MSETQEALRRLGMPLIACDECGKLMRVESYFSVLGFVNGEVADWGLFACSREHATNLIHLPDRTWRRTEQWYLDALREEDDITFSIIPIGAPSQ